jgi:hypothetical protein
MPAEVAVVFFDPAIDLVAAAASLASAGKFSPPARIVIALTGPASGEGPAVVVPIIVSTRSGASVAVIVTPVAAVVVAVVIAEAAVATAVPLKLCILASPAFGIIIAEPGGDFVARTLEKAAVL